MHPKFLYLLIVLICILFISKFNYSQVSDLKQIPLQYKDVTESASVAISDNELLFFLSIQLKTRSSQLEQQTLVIAGHSNR